MVRRGVQVRVLTVPLSYLTFAAPKTTPNLVPVMAFTGPLKRSSHRPLLVAGHHVLIPSQTSSDNPQRGPTGP